MRLPIFVIAVAFLGTSTTYTMAQQATPRATTARATGGTAPSATTSRLLPGTRGNVFTTIQGNALTSTNSALVNGAVRLRDARFGRVVDTTITDKSGMFAFRTIDPGTYIVELMGNDESVLAASELISVNAGEAATAVVKLPFRIPPFAGVLGNSAPSAAAVTAEAAASGVLATAVSGSPASERPIS
jgi:hypothetical protein